MMNVFFKNERGNILRAAQNQLAVAGLTALTLGALEQLMNAEMEAPAHPQATLEQVVRHVEERETRTMEEDVDERITRDLQEGRSGKTDRETSAAPARAPHAPKGNGRTSAKGASRVGGLGAGASQTRPEPQPQGLPSLDAAEAPAAEPGSEEAAEPAGESFEDESAGPASEQAPQTGAESPSQAPQGGDPNHPAAPAASSAPSTPASGAPAGQKGAPSDSASPASPAQPAQPAQGQETPSGKGAADGGKAPASNKKTPDEAPEDKDKKAQDDAKNEDDAENKNAEGGAEGEDGAQDEKDEDNAEKGEQEGGQEKNDQEQNEEHGGKQDGGEKKTEPDDVQQGDEDSTESRLSKVKRASRAATSAKEAAQGAVKGTIAKASSGSAINALLADGLEPMTGLFTTIGLDIYWAISSGSPDSAQQSLLPKLTFFQKLWLVGLNAMWGSVLAGILILFIAILNWLGQMKVYELLLNFGGMIF